MDIFVRHPLREDLAELHALHDEIHRLHVAAVPWMFRMPQPHTWTDDQLLEVIEDPAGLTLVAEVSGEIAGLVTAAVRHIPDRRDMNPHSYVYVDTLVVGEKWHHQGVGRTLMEAIHIWAREQEIDSVALGVWCFNTGAIAFYEELGYEAIEQRMRKTLNDE